MSNNEKKENNTANADDAAKQAQLAVKLADKNVNSTGEQIDGRRHDESERPRPAVNRPTVPENAEETEDTTSPPELKQKSGEKYYVNRNNAAGSVMVRDKDGDESKDETVRFVPFYDTWKGDQVRVGYLATDNKKAQEVLEADENVEEISFSDYKLALRGDGKRHKPLGQAPIPAA